MLHGTSFNYALVLKKGKSTFFSQKTKNNFDFFLGKANKVGKKLN